MQVVCPRGPCQAPGAIGGPAPGGRDVSGAFGVLVLFGSRAGPVTGPSANSLNRTPYAEPVNIFSREAGGRARPGKKPLGAVVKLR